MSRLYRSWKPASLALLMTLGLAGCGNGDEPAPPVAEEPPAEAVDEAPEAPEPVEEELDAEPEPAETLPEEEAVEAETLGESPATTLEEGAALPGEVTRDEIDAMLEETERRFEEAQRRIEEQFEEAEEESVVPEPLEDEEAFEFDTRLEEDPIGGPTPSDIDAIIEEQERRFEEAQRRLEEQFEAMEQASPSFEFEEFDESP